jgi:pimeloyl-ACP methyl ester carboxylesterase
MALRRVVFFGGNGHCSARLDLARPALADVGLDLVGLAYPGFEGRPRANDLEAFLDGALPQARAAAGNDGLVYATGIGGLIALCLRARGELGNAPLLLQAPVLWGLQRRLMPRLMRSRLASAVAARLFSSTPFRRLFVRRHFVETPSAEMQAAFFDGYARCAAFPDLFAWFTPGRLRQLERDLAARPAALRDITVWWGGRDRVVTPRELRWTEQALGTTWPLRVFPDWGHYPTIDAPEAWAQALGRYPQGPT